MTQRPPATAYDAVDGLDLSGKVYVVTGAYSGLGAATTEALIAAGATVVLGGRNAEAQTAFAKGLSASSQAQIDDSHTVDLSRLSSVAAFAEYLLETYPRIDCLIANAGVMNTPPGVTEDGNEIQMGTNVIGHFLLAERTAGITARQVWLSSSGHMLFADPPGNHDRQKAPHLDLDAIRNPDLDTYDSWRRYQQSKLGAILLAKQFAAEYPHLKTCAVHPGVVRTNLSRHMSVWLMMRYLFASLTGRGQAIVTPVQGARTQTFCAVMPDGQLQNGAYYADCKPEAPAVAAEIAEDAKALYDFCRSAVAGF